ncbi:MAG: prepilin-type N-terminal cleavage/methylation domain-containing protein [Opitutales bacterium]|jgi:general secretion pathway protein I|nr:prepilin-type N-terminal cleavage/methylation domain-containing protein [Opitutales bacterium]
MNRRAFSLIEVLVALAIFALAAVGLGAAYTNVLLGRQALKQYDVGAEDLARCRAALLETVNYDDIEVGGDIYLPDDRMARWQGKVEPTEVSDLFTVTLSAEIQKETGGEFIPMKEETRLLLRPTWSTASDRKVIRDAAKARLLQERGYDEATGGTKFISSPTPRKPLGGGNVQTINNGNNGRGNQPGGNNNGGNQPGGKGGNQPGGNQPGGKGGNNNVGGKTGGPTGGNPGGAPTGGGNTGGGNNQGGRGPVAPLPKQ